MLTSPTRLLLLAGWLTTASLGAKPIQPSQQVPESDPFIGKPWTARPMQPKVRYKPYSTTFHRDNGNTRSDDYHGPLGHNLTVFTSDGASPTTILFDSNGDFTGGTLCVSDSSRTCISAVDPDTLDVLGEWMTPPNILLGGTDAFYILERNGNDIRLAKEYNSTKLLGGGSGGISSTMYDGKMNFWYTNGVQLGAGFGQDITTAIAGYITPEGKHYNFRLENQISESNLALSDDMVYFVTGPAGAADTKNATGKFCALRAGAQGVEKVYCSDYEAGDGMKAGAFTRGSGSTPNLLGNEYVAITDNANTQINLLIFEQVNKGGNGNNGKLVCSVPLFEPGQSALEATFVNHFDGTSYGVLATNSYNYPMPIWFPEAGLPINGNWSDHSKMAAGLTRVDVTPQADGSVDCKVRWSDDKNSKTTSTATLSTANGLIYNYYQDLELAAKAGHYVWYLTASDWDTGKEIWRYRVGAGGIFNNNFQTPTLGPDGCVYIMVVGGTVKVCDGEKVDMSYSG